MNIPDNHENFKITPKEVILGLLAIGGYFAVMSLASEHSAKISTILDKIPEPLKLIAEEISALCSLVIK